MAVNFTLQNGRGTGSVARVNPFGELAVGPPEYDSVSSVTLDVVNTAYNMIDIRSDSYTIITGMVLTANKNVSANDATISIYSNIIGSTDRTVERQLFSTELASKNALVLLPMRILVEPARWINAETDDDDVFVTMMYYRINIKDVDQDGNTLSP
jgi:hypothetical protein